MVLVADIDTVRRGIICAADSTSEGAILELSDDGREHWSFDDWRQPHVCRDWDAVQDWMKAHKKDI